LVGRIRELVGEQPEARDRRRPAPVGRLEGEQVALERVAGLRAVDRDGPVDLVDAREVERRDLLDGRRLGQRAVAGAEQAQLDLVAVADGLDRRDGRVPGEMEPVAADVDQWGRAHRLSLSPKPGAECTREAGVCARFGGYFTVNVPSARTPASSSTRMRYSAGERPVSASCS